MGVALRIEGRYEADITAAEWMDRLKGWFESDLAADETWGELRYTCKVGPDHEGRPAMLARLHPSAEGVEVSLPAPGRVRFTAKTSLVGPGYHIAVCQILKKLGEENGVTWLPEGKGDDFSADDTGYFFRADWRGVEKAMLRYLRTIANLAEQTLKGARHGGEMTLSMPLRHSYFGGPIRTTTGTRDMAWLARARDNTRNGLDLYPWWEEGFTAQFYLGRALCDLWLNVRWRRTEKEDEDSRLKQTHEDVVADLRRAYRLDPTLAYPWREWAELLDLLGGEPGPLDADVRGFAAEAKPGPPIGYRRRRVGVSLADGWRIGIAGDMEEKWEDGSWCAWDDQRSVWFSSWSFRSETGAPPPPSDELLQRIPDEFEGEHLSHRDGELTGRGVLSLTEGEDGEPLWNLKGFSAVPGALALCNVYYHDEKDRQWAIDQWHSLIYISRQPERATV